MSDKFADVAVGDTVLYRHEESFGFSQRLFYLPARVVRLTKTQFMACRDGSEVEVAFRKSDGKGVGSRELRAYRDGDVDWGKRITDETALLRAFRKDRAALNKARTLADDISKKVSIDTQNLGDLVALLEKAHDMVKPKETQT